MGETQENNACHTHRVSGPPEEVTTRHSGSQEKHQVLARWQEIARKSFCWGLHQSGKGQAGQVTSLGLANRSHTGPQMPVPDPGMSKAEKYFLLGRAGRSEEGGLWIGWFADKPKACSGLSPVPALRPG